MIRKAVYNKNLGTIVDIFLPDRQSGAVEDASEARCRLAERMKKQ